MFIVVLILIAPNWKPPKYQSAAGSVNKLGCIHAMECSRTMKMNIPLLHTTTQMNLTNTMLRERSQTKKSRCFTALFVLISKNR